MSDDKDEKILKLVHEKEPEPEAKREFYKFHAAVMEMENAKLKRDKLSMWFGTLMFAASVCWLLASILSFAEFIGTIAQVRGSIE